MASLSYQADDPIITMLKQRMVSRAAPRLTHDLNNDLTIIGGQAELAQRRGTERLHERMEQIKLAARSAQTRNLLLQQLEQDDDATAELSHGADIADEVQRLAALLSQRNLATDASVNGPLPTVNRTRLRWITAAVLMAALPNGISPGHMTMTMSRGAGGLRFDCHARGVELAEWLEPTLARCATAADVNLQEGGWQALIMLAEAI
ncbi:MAG: hypothetical protein JJT88_11240 [Gammaproteobacteria bacterium]|nr:hypothetical protein [Gammaproteobacteria bacterium]